LKTISMVDLPARHRQAADDVEARVLQVLRSGAYVGGSEVRAAEQTAARRFGRADAVGVNSGTDALVLALQAVGVRAGHEVIVPALSFFATAGAVRALGAVPVVVDVLEDGCMDPDAARHALTGRTRAVVPVHLFGTMAPLPPVSVPVVDDAAQAVGGDPPRSVGVLTGLSTYPTKTWGGAGDGGFVVGDDETLLALVRRQANHGLVDGVYRDLDGMPGGNSRLDAIQAAVLLGQEPWIAPRVAHRRALATRYDAGLPTVVRPLPRDLGSPVQQYMVLLEERERVRAALADSGIETRVYYPRPLNREPAIATQAHTPVADDLCARLLALPVHSALTTADVDHVLECLHRAVGR